MFLIFNHPSGIKRDISVVFREKLRSLELFVGRIKIGDRTKFISKDLRYLFYIFFKSSISLVYMNLTQFLTKKYLGHVIVRYTCPLSSSY